MLSAAEPPGHPTNPRRCPKLAETAWATLWEKPQIMVVEEQEGMKTIPVLLMEKIGATHAHQWRSLT